MSQVKTRSVKLKTIIYNRYFTMGFNDVIKGNTFSSDYDKWQTSDQWQYERGRQFAILTNGEISPKVGKRVNNRAIWAFGQLLTEGAMI